MLCTHQRLELLTLCLVSLMTFSIYKNKLNSCTFLIPKGCPIIRGNKQLHSPCRLPQGFRSGGAEGSVKHPLLRDTTNPRSWLLFSASFCISTWDFWCRWETWPNDWSICHHWRSTLEGGGGEDSARWLNQQRSFHVRRMLPFTIRSRLSCAFYCFFLWQRWEQRGKCDHYHNLNYYYYY